MSEPPSEAAFINDNDASGAGGGGAIVEEKTALCKVLRRSVDKDGKTTGIYDKDPSLNTMIYDVEFPDGAVKQYGANIIAQNVLEQVEDDGHYTVKTVSRSRSSPSSFFIFIVNATLKP